MYGLPLRDPAGDVRRAFVVAPDVSEHVNRQRELERLQREVRTEVSERVEDVVHTIDDVALFAEEAEAFAGEQADRMSEVTARRWTTWAR